MSEREQIQRRIADVLREDSSYWDAPFGIIEGMRSVGRGKVRTVTFGVARYLDAEVTIWNPKKITIRGEGGLAYKVEGEYASAGEVIEALKDAARGDS